jgi:hypothetical protein
MHQYTLKRIVNKNTMNDGATKDRAAVFQSMTRSIGPISNDQRYTPKSVPGPVLGHKRDQSDHFLIDGDVVEQGKPRKELIGHIITSSVFYYPLAQC